MKEKSGFGQERILIYLLAAIQFSYIVDFVVMMPLGPLLMNQFKISPAQFGVLVSSYNYAAAVSGLSFGLIADRYARKVLFGRVMFGFIVGTLFCGLSMSYAQLLAARIFTGLFGGILNALVFIIVTDIVPFERRGKAMGIVMSSFSIAAVVGVPLGLIIADSFGWQWTFFFIASFSSLIWVVALRILPTLADHVQKSRPAEIVKRYLKIGTNGKYVKAYGLIFMAALTIFILIPFLAPYAVKNIGIETYEIKYMYFFAGAATVVTSRLFGALTDRFGPLRMYTILAIISIVPIYIYTNAGPMSVLYYILTGMLFMTIVSGRMVPCMTLVSGVPHQNDRGTFMGLLNSVRAFGSATATMVGGMIITEENNRFLHFDKVGLLSIFLVLVSIFVAKSIRVHKASFSESEVANF